jgi:hypothetical protein
MISIIISSANKKLLDQLFINIQDTIGVEYEIVSFDNGKGEKGINEIYNLGTKKAQYDILCYMHEDIRFETADWGKKVIDLFSHHDIGLLGVAGSTYKSGVPSSWFPSDLFGRSSWRLNIKQQSKFKEAVEKHDYYNPLNERLAEVACVDGVWFCTTKEMALAYPFDEQLLTGFHGYDIDYSLTIGQVAKVYVTFDVLITHLSEGNFNEHWLKEMIKVHEKWDSTLPKNIHAFHEKVIAEKEKIALASFLKSVIKNKTFSKPELKDLILYYYRLKRIRFTKVVKLLFKVLSRR